MDKIINDLKQCFRDYKELTDALERDLAEWEWATKELCTQIAEMTGRNNYQVLDEVMGRAEAACTSVVEGGTPKKVIIRDEASKEIEDGLG